MMNTSAATKNFSVFVDGTCDFVRMFDWKMRFSTFFLYFRSVCISCIKLNCFCGISSEAKKKKSYVLECIAFQVENNAKCGLELVSMWLWSLLFETNTFAIFSAIISKDKSGWSKQLFSLIHLYFVFSFIILFDQLFLFYFGDFCLISSLGTTTKKQNSPKSYNMNRMPYCLMGVKPKIATTVFDAGVISEKQMNWQWYTDDATTSHCLFFSFLRH